MSLRDYQQRMDEKRRASNARSRCDQMPTGSGKSLLAREVAMSTTSLVAMVHREYLVDQLASIIPDAQTIKAGDKWDRKSKKIIGMVQTLSRRSPEDLPTPDHVITDECHRVAGATFQKVLAYWPKAQLDGYTATPIRLDGQGLDGTFDELITGPQIGELIEAGYLKPFELYSVPGGIEAKNCKIVRGDHSVASQNDAIRKSTIFGDVVEHWHRLGRDGGHISFWPSIEAAEHAAEQVPSWKVLHSKLSPVEITDRRRALEAGSIDSLATVDMVSEGLDIAGIASVSRCRLTKSLSLWMQQNGRPNRGGEGVARIISHVDDWRVHGHGMPDDDREWTLKGRVKTRREPGVLSVWDCPECWAVCRSSLQACWKCGTPKPREIRIIEERAVELELIKRLTIDDIHDHCKTGEDYVAFAKAKGKKPAFGIMRFWDRKHRTNDDAFSDLEIITKPTLEEFINTAGECGVSRTYAEFAGEKMRLINEERMFQG